MNVFSFFLQLEMAYLYWCILALDHHQQNTSNFREKKSEYCAVKMAHICTERSHFFTEFEYIVHDIILLDANLR